MLKLGDKSISKLYLGDKIISKAYLGEKLVFNSQPIFLEYIETDGNSYIDTEYCPSENTVIEYTFEIVSKPTGSFNGLFGSRLDTSRYSYNVFCKSYLQLRIDYGHYDETVYQCALNTKYTIKAGSNQIYINDELVKSYTVSYTGTSPYSMYLGNFNGAGTPYATGTAQRIYATPIYENGTLVHNYLPCIAPNGQACMYDEVTKKYHYNKGTGEIKPGYIPLDYVIFDGDSYIDTGLKHVSCRIETAVKYEAGQSRRMLTGWSGAGSYWGMTSNGKLEVSGANVTTETNLTDYTTLEIVLDNENLLFTVTADNATKTVQAVYASNTYTIGCSTPSSANKIIGNVYYHRAYNTDGVLIQDLRPCIDPDGTVCFYDMVTKKYFYNQGTGTLTFME